jgi:hypothetical protein
MMRALSLLVIGGIFGAMVGFLVAAGYGITLDGHDHATDHHDTDKQHAAMHSKMIDLSDMANPPSVKLMVMKDTVSGWNLHLQTEHFRFAADQSGAAHKAGHGHAHLYVDGIKISRLYGEWAHLGGLTPGEHVIRVTLNANSHEALAVGDMMIAAEATVIQE